MVRRYSIYQDNFSYPPNLVEDKDKDGRWVEYSDYDRLATLARELAEITRLYNQSPLVMGLCRSVLKELGEVKDDHS